MAHRPSFFVCASVLIGLASIAVAPSAALAKKAKVATKAVAVVDTGPAVITTTRRPADLAPRCFDSVIMYPSPPCY
jgi:hypothetical protein